MIQETINEREYNILGMCIKVKPNEEDKATVPSHQVIDFVQEKIEELKAEYPNLDEKQMAVLMTMNMARELLELNVEYKESVEFFKSSAIETKNLIESMTPQ